MATQLSSLDDAWSEWVGGRPEPAIRCCLAILEADSTQETAAALLAVILADEGDDRAKVHASRLVDVFVDRGDLPRAVALAKAAGEGLERVALAFGVQSDRVADVAPSPPPLPLVTSASSRLRSATSAELGDLADVALSSVASSERGGTKVPHLPLFGHLGASALEELLEVTEVRTFPAGARVIEQGEAGTEAYVVVRGHLRACRASGAEETVLAELGPGAIFGEMALVSGAPRAASVIALEPVQVLVGSVKALDRVAEKSKVVGRQLSRFCRARMVSNLIRHSQILGAIAPGERSALMSRFETKTFERGEKLVERDTQPEGLFLIASGQVRVLGLDADGDELVVAELGPGDVVGEIGLVLRRPATADVVATHHTVALELTRTHFREAIEQHPKLLGELYDLATKRDDELRTVVAQETLDVEDVVLL